MAGTREGIIGGLGFKVMAALLAVVALQGLTATAHANQADYRRSINLADNQAMLMQKMSKEMLLVALGVDQDDNLERLESTQDLFDRTLWGLRDGDTELRLPSTTHPAILDHLTLVEDLWPPFDDAIRHGVQIREVKRKMIDALAEVEPPLFEAMNRATKAYVDEANKIQMHSFLAVAINLAGRQRMLSQKMTKEFLLIAYGYNVEQNRARLKESIALFDQTLNGLTTGNPRLRLFPPPNKAILRQLTEVQELWDKFMPQIKIAADGKEPSRKEIQEIARMNVPLLEEMDRAVSLYEAL